MSSNGDQEATQPPPLQPRLLAAVEGSGGDFNSGSQKSPQGDLQVLETEVSKRGLNKLGTGAHQGQTSESRPWCISLSSGIQPFCNADLTCSPLLHSLPGLCIASQSLLPPL